MNSSLNKQVGILKSIASLLQQEQSETAYVRQEEYGLDPKSHYPDRDSGFLSPDPDYFHNLTGTSLSKDTSVIKFLKKIRSLSPEISQIVEKMFYLTVLNNPSKNPRCRPGGG